MINFILVEGLNNLGCTLQVLQQYKPAAQFYDLAFKLSEKLPNIEKVVKGDIASNIAEVFKFFYFGDSTGEILNKRFKWIRKYVR